MDEAATQAQAKAFAEAHKAKYGYYPGEGPATPETQGRGRPRATLPTTGMPQSPSIPTMTSKDAQMPGMTPLTPGVGGVPATIGTGGGVYGSGEDDSSWLGKLLGYGGDALGWLFKGTSGADVLKAGGDAASAAIYANQIAQNRAQQKAQFERTQQGLEGQQAVQAETRLNRAPLADRAQAVLMQHMAPETFRPRDYTKGPIANQTATGTPDASVYRNAEANYKTGDGGVNTDTLKLLLAKMRGNAGLA